MTAISFHTRSLRRRFFAFIIDTILVFVALTALIYPFANSLDSPLRLSEGGIHIELCAPGQVFDRAGNKLSTEGWSAVQICDRTTNGLFPSRDAVFVKVETTDGTTYNQFLGFPVDGNNRMSNPLIVDALVALLWLLAAALFESSRMMATPGKRLLGLQVCDETGGAPTFVRALTRNFLKLPYAIAVGVLGIVSSFTLVSLIENNYLTPDHRVLSPLALFGPLAYAGFTALAIVALFNLIMIASIFLPWRSAGRGLYDRLAGTHVE